MIFKNIGTHHVVGAVGAIAVFLSSRFLFNLDSVDAAILSILTEITSIIFGLNLKYDKSLTYFQSVLSIIGAGNSSYLNICQYGVTKIPRENMPKVWQELISITKTQFLATSYISPTDGWEQAYTNASLEIQRVKSKVYHVDIKRIFIVDSEDEKQRFSKEFEKQKEYGLFVKSITKEEISNHSMLRTLSTNLETFDFGIYDSNCILLWHLNKKREVVNGELIFDKTIVEKYKAFFNELLNTARAA